MGPLSQFHRIDNFCDHRLHVHRQGEDDTRMRCQAIAQLADPTEINRTRAEQTLNEIVDPQSSAAEVVAQMLEELLSESKSSGSRALMGLTVLRERQGRNDEAFRAINRAIDLDPKSIVHRNNPVWFEALYRDGSAGETLPMVNQVIVDAGPLDAILDTKAIVYCQDQQYAAAAQLLYTVASSVSAPANVKLHYAHCCQVLGEQRTATVVFQDCREQLKNLTPFETRLMDELQREVDNSKVR